ncbi:MFS transporter [Flindersiella endophytica]
MKRLWYQAEQVRTVEAVTTYSESTTPQAATAQTSTGQSPPLGGADASAGTLRALPFLLLGLFLGLSNFFIVNIALPSIGRSLHAQASLVQLVVAAFSASYAATLVASGRLGDRYGRKKLFVAGVAAIGLAGLGCAAATNIWMLTGARLVQGIAAGLITPQVLGTIQATLTGPARNRAIGLYGATAGLATVVGQLLGGVAAEFDIAGLEWRGVFILYAPLGLLTAYLAHRLAPESRGAHSRLDLVGALLLALTLALVLVPLSVGSAAGWPVWTFVMLALAPLAAAGFGYHQHSTERGGRTPLLPTSLLRGREFRRGLAVVVLFFLATGGFFLTTGVSLQEGLGMSPLGTALALAPYALGFLAASLAGPRLIGRFGTGRVIVAGALVLTAAFAVLATQTELSYPRLTGTTLVPALTVVGIAQGFVMPPLFGFVLTSVPATRAGLGAGVLTTTQQSSLAVGVALLGTLFFAWAHGPARTSGWAHGTTAAFLVEGALSLLAGLAAYLATRSR